MFKERKFYEKLLKVALPIAIQNLIVSSLNMFDTIMVGKLGEKAVASVGVANQFSFIEFNIFGICGGCSVYLAQYWGKKDKGNIRKIIGVGVITVSVIGAIFTLAAISFPESIIWIFSRDKEVITLASSYLRIVSISYVFTGITVILSSSLRCMEKTISPMIISSIAVVINIIFNYILIFGKFGFPKLGVDGSATATLIARIIECILIVYMTSNKRSIIYGSVKEYLDFDKQYYWKIIKDTLPVVVNETCWALGTISYSVAYGFIGTYAQASIQICGTVQNLFMIIIFGVANGSLVMIGNEVGAGNEKTAKLYAKKFYVISILVGVLLAITMTLSAPFVMTFFKVSDDVVRSAINIIKMMSIIVTFKAFNIVAVVGILRGGGDVKCAMYIEVFTMWFIGVPMAFLGALLFKLPVHLVVALTGLEEASKFILCIIRLKSNKWIRNIV